MEWFYFASLSAIALGFLAGISKELMARTDVYTFSALVHALALVIYTPYFIYRADISSIVIGGITAAILSGILNVLAVYLYNTSIKIGDLSEEIPLTRLSPVFTAILGVILLGETMNIQKGSGIILVTIGSIVIMKEPGYSVLDSFKKIFTKKAAAMAVMCSVVYGITAIIDRVGTQLLEPQLYTFFIYLIIATSFLGIAQKKKQPNFKKILIQDKNRYLTSALLALIGSLSIFQAFSMAEASLVMPVLQLQVFIAIGLGGIYFEEKEILTKTIGATILITGLILIV